MPARFRQKTYISGGYYHIYNRGVEGKTIFEEDKDYLRFLEILKGYVSKQNATDARFRGESPSVVRRKIEMGLEGEVDVIAYCLLPDHFHLLVKQNKADGITKLMRRLVTAYVMYFNKKKNRRGPLFENIYRAVQVSGVGDELEGSLRLLVNYMHLHPIARTERRLGPIKTVSSSDPEDYMYSSYNLYIGNIYNEWVNIGLVKDVANKLKSIEIQAQVSKWPTVKDLPFD